MYDDIRDAVEEVLDPDRFLEGAPSSVLACRAASVELNLGGWNYRGRVEATRTVR